MAVEESEMRDVPELTGQNQKHDDQCPQSLIFLHGARFHRQMSYNTRPGFAPNLSKSPTEANRSSASALEIAALRSWTCCSGNGDFLFRGRDLASAGLKGRAGDSTDALLEMRG